MVARFIWVAVIGFMTSICQAISVDEYVRQQMVAQKIPAVVWAVFKDGKVVRSSAYGKIDLERDTSARTDSVFEIGSVSKQFTTTAALMLYENGKLGLDDRIDKYLIDLPDAWRPVTVRQLMAHTSGIPDMEAIFGYESYRNIYTEKQIIDIANSKPMDFEPGKGWAYSNTGYYLLAMVLEKISGKPHGQYLKEVIFDPLGMSHTSESDPDRVIPNRARGYMVGKDGSIENRDPMQSSACKGAGTLVSTVEDMAKWDKAITTHRLLKPETQRLMFTAEKLPDGLSPYGLGWFIAPWRGHESYEHSGGTAGFSCDYRRFEKEGFSVMVLTNLYAIGPGNILIRVADDFHPGLSYVSMKAIEDRNEMADKFLEAMLHVSKKVHDPLITDEMWKSYAEVSFSDWAERLKNLKRFELIYHETYPARQERTGVMVTETYAYRLLTGDKELYIEFRMTPEGKIGLQSRTDN